MMEDQPCFDTTAMETLGVAVPFQDYQTETTTVKPSPSSPLQDMAAAGRPNNAPSQLSEWSPAITLLMPSADLAGSYG